MSVTSQRLQDILHSWRLSMDAQRRAIEVTPPAHVAREQVRELVAEVRRLQELVRCKFHVATHAGAPIVPGTPSTYERCTLEGGHQGDCKP